MAEFVLYNYYRSSASYRVRIALNLKEIPFEYRAVHLLNDGGEQHKVEYRALNPSAQVPTLVHQGHAFAQSLPILEYLDDIHPLPRLFPQDPVQRAQVRQLCEMVNCLQPMQNTSTTKYLGQQLGLSQDQQKTWVRHWISQTFEAIEMLLVKTAGVYSFGDHVTAADCFLVPQVFAAERFHVEIAKFPKLLEVTETLKKRDAFQRAHPFIQSDCPADQRQQ